MECKSFFHLFLFFLLVGLASSSYISNDVFEFQGSLGRSLLQQKNNCPLNLETLNYTVVTSQCKGPHYTKERCCPPLKELLCPIRDEINDMKNNCMEIFTSYANLYGKYPAALFANLCTESKEGLDCGDIGAPPPAPSSASKPTQFNLHLLMAGLPILLFNLF
ncbi:LORELEI-LIKE-GPI ANCHORED PROTEIN 3 [Abeliophyllum distichum]|uniref:LORELEI-LIKE-GPI ANCHORED PROTEIN 3 n=1 Tax=Abeliophyllum distichum TaxID=126358 RepID=A0ABD1QGB9_9LAMI